MRRHQSAFGRPSRDPQDRFRQRLVRLYRVARDRLPLPLPRHRDLEKVASGGIVEREGVPR
jgi:hypothetical protein